MKYRERTELTRDEAAALLASPDPAIRCSALVDAAFTVPDWEWVQTECLRRLDSVNPDERCCACWGLEYIAMRGKLNLAEVIPRLEALLSDPEAGGVAQDVLEGLRTIWKPAQWP